VIDMAALLWLVMLGAAAAGDVATLSLRQAVGEALRRSPELAPARDAVADADLTMREAHSQFGLKLQPGFSTQTEAPGYVQHRYGVAVGKRLPTGTDLSLRVDATRYSDVRGRFDDAGYTFSVSQPLTNGFWRTTTLPLSQARDARDDAARGLDQRRQQLVVDVAAAFVNATRARRLVGAAEQAVARATRVREMMRARAGSGLATQLDVMRADLAVAQSEMALGEQQEAVASSDDRLRTLLGWPPGRAVVLADGALPIEDARGPAALDVGAAIARRLDVATLRAQVASRRMLERLAASPVPPVTVDVSYTRRGLLGQGVPGWNDLFGGWRVGLSSSHAMDRSTASIGAARRQSHTRAAERALAELESRVQTEIEASARQVTRAEAALAIARGALTIAERAAELAQLRHERGLATSVELLDAGAQRFTASAQLAAADADLQLARLRFTYVRGAIDPEEWQ
jgi:outer membrane protein TolC